VRGRLFSGKESIEHRFKSRFIRLSAFFQDLLPPNRAIHVPVKWHNGRKAPSGLK